MRLMDVTLGGEVPARLSCYLPDARIGTEASRRSGRASCCRRASSSAIPWSRPPSRETPSPPRGTAGAPQAEVEWTCRGIFGTTSPTEDDYAELDLTRHVRPELPRTFIWQTADDATVRPQETLRLVSELMAAGVPCETHLFEHGPHGMSLADWTIASRPGLTDPHVATWVDLALAWMARP